MSTDADTIRKQSVLRRYMAGDFAPDFGFLIPLIDWLEFSQAARDDFEFAFIERQMG